MKFNKNFSALSLCLCFFVNVHSQSTIKILFDSKKAESSGNADWVIDADQWNIKWNPNATLSNSNNHANAQRFPTPSQSLITSSTPETFWTGGISYWGIDCVKKGYQVETLPYNGQITYGNSSNQQDLSNYKVYIVCEPNILFTASEKTAMMKFVKNGGSLFMIADHTISDRNFDGKDSPDIWNDFISNNGELNNGVGFLFDLADFSQTSSAIPNLPGDSLLYGPMGGVNQVKWSGGTSISIFPSQNPTVKGIIYKTGSNAALCAYSRVGKGKIAAIGDSSPADDNTGDPNDILYDGYIADASGNHQRLLMNITIWLAGGLPVAANIKENFIAPISIFPNPTYNLITIEFVNDSEDYTAEILDVSGNLVKTVKFNGAQNILSLEDFKAGLYILKILYNKNLINIQKVIKID